MPSETPLEIRQEWARLRQIMYEPSSVWLATDGTERWLTDQFVLYKVTGAYTIQWTDGISDKAYDDEWADGPYKLTVSKGLEPRKSVPPPDLDRYFNALENEPWYEAIPSEWSVAEHPGKAQLWVSDDMACLLGESTWTAIKKHHPEVQVEYGARSNVFRFSEIPAEHAKCLLETEVVYCGHHPMPFAYAAGIRVPEGQGCIAEAIARELDSTSNHAVGSEHETASN